MENETATLKDVAENVSKTWTYVYDGRPSVRLQDPTDGTCEMWELSKPVRINDVGYWVVLLDADYAKHDGGWGDAEHRENEWLKVNGINPGPYRTTRSGGKHWLALVPEALCSHLTARTGEHSLDGVDLLTGRVWGLQGPSRAYVWQNTDLPVPVLTERFLTYWDLTNSNRGSLFRPTSVELTDWQWAIARSKSHNYLTDINWSERGGRETALWSACLNYADSIRPLMGSDDATWRAMQWFAEQYLPLVDEPWSQSWDAFTRSNPGLYAHFLEDRDEQGRSGYVTADQVPPFNGLSDVLNAVVDYNRRFIYHKDDATHDVIALWVAHTYAMDKWFTSPRLYINAPQAGVGKSQQARVIQSLSRNGRKVSSGSPAYLFAKVAETDGSTTLLFDEADNIWSKGRDTAELQALINDGWEPGAVVGRGHASDKGVVAIEYPAYCPVAISGIKNSRIPATTLSRCIAIQMGLPATKELRPKERHWAIKFQDEAQALREWLEIGMCDVPAHYEPDGDDGWGRQWDVWVSLFAIADYAGNDWPVRVRHAYSALTTDEQPLSPQQKVLKYVCEYFLASDTNWATPSELADYVNNQDDLFDLDGKRVSYYLSNYGIQSRKSNGKKVWDRDNVLAEGERWELLGVYGGQEPTLTYPDLPCDTTEQGGLLEW